MSDTLCIACGQPASIHHGLPVDDSGEIVASDYGGDWAAQPACAVCYRVHDAGGLAALDAVTATKRLRAQLALSQRGGRRLVVAAEPAAVAGVGR